MFKRIFGLTIIITICVASRAHATTMCDKKKRMQACASYKSCEDCVACDNYCSWCEVGGLCSRFCEAVECTSDSCPRSSEYRCMLMAENPGGSDGKSSVDYKKEGGIESPLYQNGMKSGLLRGVDNAPNQPQKVRPFHPLSRYSPD